jgi:hypothetical protein
MANGAHVQDLEGLECFLGELAKFQDRLSKQSDEVRMEIQRVHRWIEDESPTYWREQDRLAKRRCVEAREALAQCQTVTRAGERPACTEQKKRYEKCQARVALCERKLRTIKQFQLEWQQEQQKLQLKLQQVIDVVESRLPQARLHLDGLLEPLRRYTKMTGAKMTGAKMTGAKMTGAKMTGPGTQS